MHSKKSNPSLLSRFFLLLSIFIASSCKQQKDTGMITGKLLNAKQITVYLQQIDDKNGEHTLDSTVTDEEGNFQIPNLADKLDYYLLRTSPTNVIFLVLKGGETIEVTGDAENMDTTYTVKGSEDSEAICRLRKYEKHLSDSLNGIYVSARQADPLRADSIGPLLQAYYSATMGQFAESFIAEHSRSIAALSAMRFLDQQNSLELMDSLDTNLSALYPENKYVKDFSLMMKELHKLPPGSVAPDILLPDTAGTMIPLSSLKGKVVLVDFWASWCGPCRKENPFVVDLYKRYKARGFEIYGISLDDNMNAWKQAILKDGITWTQVSELKKWGSECVKTYGVDAIPFSVLLDRDGKIIAKGLRGDELEQKIQETLLKNS